MKNTQKYKTGWGFIDLLFNLLVGFTFMFILAFVLINPVAKKETVDPKAEYLFIVTWDPNSSYDIDTWLKDQDGVVISFRSKDKNLVTLDRDDLGRANDVYQDEKGNIEVRKINREIMAIRSSRKRDYWLTVHWFGKGQVQDLLSPPPEGAEGEMYNIFPDTGSGKGEKLPPIEVQVEVIRVNPFTTLSTKRVWLRSVGEEKGVYKLSVQDSKNAVVTDSDDKIVYSTSRIKKEW